MRKLFLVGALALFGAMNAQVKYGAKAGLNIATLNGDVEGAKSLVGFHVGGFAQVPLAAKFTFQPEVVYSAQGAKEDGGNGKWNLGYINVPLMFKYAIAEKFNVEAGPQIGFLVSAKAKQEGVSVDIKDELNSVDFSIGLGASYDFTQNLSADVRYNAGVSNLIKDSEGDYKATNGVFQIGLGYKF